MRFTSASRALAVSLLVGIVAARPRSRLQSKIISGRSRSEDSKQFEDGDITIYHRESFTVNETVSSDNLALNFVNSDEVECELSSTGPANFQIFMNTLLANGDVNYDLESSSKLYAIFNCTTFKFSREMDRTKASLFSVASSDYKTPVHVTGGCTLTSERRSLRAPTNPGLELTHRLTKKGNTQTLDETVAVPYNGVVPIDLGTGLTNIAWRLSSTADVSYMLLETEEWAKMEAANLFDADDDNDKPVAASVCLDMYGSAASRDSVPVDPSHAYTFVVFNDDFKNATVSGKITTTSK